MPDDINALRSVLFDTLRGLRNKTIDPDTARSQVEVAKVIVDSARVEVEMARITGQDSGSGFIPRPTETPAGNAPSSSTVTPVPGGRVVTHRLKG